MRLYRSACLQQMEACTAAAPVTTLTAGPSSCTQVYPSHGRSTKSDTNAAAADERRFPLTNPHLFLTRCSSPRRSPARSKMPSLRLSPGFPSPSIRRRHVILTVLVCLTAYTLLVSSPTVPDNWREMLKLPDHRAASYEDINDDKLRIRRTGQRPHRPRSPPLHPSETLVVLQERIRDLSEGSAEVLDQLERDMKLEMRIWPEACGDFGERQIAAHDRYNFAPDTTPVIVSHVRNYWVDNSPPGGFADRVKGLITAFALAIALEMPFFLNWDEDVTVHPTLPPLE